MTPPKGGEGGRKGEERGRAGPLIPLLLSRNLARLILPFPRGVLASRVYCVCIYCVAAVAVVCGTRLRLSATCIQGKNAEGRTDGGGIFMRTERSSA